MASSLDGCATCGASAPPYVCSKCLAVAYCSSSCQTRDWKSHKRECGRGNASLISTHLGEVAGQAPTGGQPVQDAPLATPSPTTTSPQPAIRPLNSHTSQPNGGRAAQERVQRQIDTLGTPLPESASPNHTNDIMSPVTNRRAETVSVAKAPVAQPTPASSLPASRAGTPAVWDADQGAFKQKEDDYDSDADSFCSADEHTETDALNATVVDNDDVYDTADFDPHTHVQGSYTREQLLERDHDKQYLIAHLEIDELIKTAAWVLHQAFELRKDERLYQSRRMFVLVKDSCTRCIPLLRLNEDPRLNKVLAINHFYDHNHQIQYVLTESNQCDEVLEFIKDSDDWKLVRQSAKIGTWFRYEEGSTKCAMKVVGDVPVNIVSCVSLLNEIDLAHMWLPRTKESSEVEKVNLCSKTAYLQLNFSWPLWNRDMFVYGCGYDMTEDGTVMVIIKSLENGAFRGGRYVRPCKDCPKRVCRMELLTSGYKFELLAPDRTRVTILLHSDPKIGFIPDSVLNFMSRQLAFLAMVFFRKIALQITSSAIHAQRMRENPRLYRMILERATNYFNDPDNASMAEEYKWTEEEIAAREKQKKKGKKELTLLLEDLSTLWPADQPHFEELPALIHPPDPDLNPHLADEIV